MSCKMELIDDDIYEYKIHICKMICAIRYDMYRLSQIIKIQYVLLDMDFQGFLLIFCDMLWYKIVTNVEFVWKCP